MTTKTESYSFLNKLTRKVAYEYLEALDSPTSLGLSLCLKYKDDFSACSHSIDPLSYNDSDKFAADYLAANLLSKFRFSPKSYEKIRKDEAIKKFWACEDRLKESSVELRKYLYSPNLKANSLSQMLYLAREKIGKILGPVAESFKIENCGFGPGSSSSIPRRKAHPSTKFLAKDVTSCCAPFVQMFFSELSFPCPELAIRESSKVTIVPKNFKSDRVIAIEPDWNIFFQKGIGSAIRMRLRRVGLDLDHASDHHGQLACQSSLDALLATIDLSSASDSISVHLIRFLLPDDWFFVLNSFRTDCVELGGKTIHLTKFSSMGNGFTFELESLVFYALALACAEYNKAQGVISVFGDDIIAPTAIIPHLTQLLNLSGFQVNLGKSFSTGYFRESCGYHFFDGRDVKPYYLREQLTNDSTKFKCCNSIRSTAYRFYCHRIGDTPLCVPYSTCKRSIRRVYYIPKGYGDGGLVSSFDEASPQSYRRKDCNVRRHPNCIEGYKVRCLLPVAVSSSSDTEGMLMHKLRSLDLINRRTWSDAYLGGVLPSRLDKLMAYLPRSFLSAIDPQIGNQFSISSATPKYRVGFMHVAQWCDPEVA